VEIPPESLESLGFCAWIITSRGRDRLVAITSFGLHARPWRIITRAHAAGELMGKVSDAGSREPNQLEDSSARRIASGSCTFSWRTIGRRFVGRSADRVQRSSSRPWEMIEMSFIERSGSRLRGAGEVRR